MLLNREGPEIIIILIQREYMLHEFFLITYIEKL